MSLSRLLLRRESYVDVDLYQNRLFLGMVWSVLGMVWSVPGWNFRPPRTLHERVALIQLQLTVVATLFSVSDYPTSYVGGAIQAIGVPPPYRVMANLMPP